MVFFPDILLKASESQNLTDDYLRAEVDTFMFEGHDTTANAMSFATYLLARYPNVQSKAREELDQIFGNDLGMKTREWQIEHGTNVVVVSIQSNSSKKNLLFADWLFTTTTFVPWDILWAMDITSR